jgi:hypothetical protein
MTAFAMLASLAACLADLGGASVAPDARCHWIECNEVVDDEGRTTLRQVVFWDFDEDDCRFRCVGYVVVQRKPVARRAGGGWRVFLAEAGKAIDAPAYSSTTTREDPELRDREIHPVERRRKLWP